MRIAGILQPSYLSWPGHYYWIKNCDVFILLDDVQFTRHDWRNRNYIKTPRGKQLITIPVHWYGNSYCLINQIEIANEHKWADNQLKTLRLAYARAPYFKDYFPYLEDILLRKWKMLSQLTITTMKDMANFLNIKTPIMVSSDFNISPTNNSTEKLVKLCREVGVDTYLAGRRGYENYIDHRLFSEAGINIIVKDYISQEYPQLWGAFISHLSVVDLLFNCGLKSSEFLEDSTAYK